MNIIQTITNNPDLQALAAAEDWSSLAAAWPQTRLPDRRSGGGSTMDALLASGQTMLQINSILAAIEDAPQLGRIGQGLITILNGSDGVNWADPKTQGLLAALRSDEGPITQSVIDTLTGLSQCFADTPTAEQIRAAWQRDAVQSIWIARSAVVAEGIHDGTITTIEQIVAVIGGE